MIPSILVVVGIACTELITTYSGVIIAKYPLHAAPSPKELPSAERFPRPSIQVSGAALSPHR